VEPFFPSLHPTPAPVCLPHPHRDTLTFSISIGRLQGFRVKLAPVDYVILAIYFGFVLGIGWRLKRSVSSSGDFLTSGRSVPVWITSLAFLAANLGAQEVIGMSASGAKYGIMTAHFYWIGAVPAMLFVGIFMMPFYYGSRARSVPEFLKLRFDEKTRGLNAITFAVMTVFSSGVSMYALGLLLQLVLGWSFTASVLLSAAIVLVYTFLGGVVRLAQRTEHPVGHSPHVGAVGLEPLRQPLVFVHRSHSLVALRHSGGERNPADVTRRRAS